jgi:hypothetical protein
VKPTLEYRSRIEAVSALDAQGLRVRDIAQKTGLTSKNVSSLLCHVYKRAGKARRRPPGLHRNGGRQFVAFPVGTIAMLEPQAQKRGITPQELVRRIVETALDEGMIDNILDDGDEL